MRMLKKKKKIMLIIFVITIILNICVLAVVSEKRNVLFGDADKNNIVDKEDAIKILDKIAEKKGNKTSSISIPLTADTNLDNEINLIDVVDIARYDKAKKETHNSGWITKLEKEVEFEITEKVIIDLSKTENGKVEVQSKNCGDIIIFESRDTNIAEVDANGNITAKQHGQTQIVVTEGRIGISKECTVIVQTSPTGITLNETSATLDLSGTKTVNLTGTITPNTSSTSTKITWTTSDNKIATVDSVGKVTGVSNGTTTITATTANGKKAECTIIVQTSPTSIKINEIETKLVKESLQLKTTMIPATVDVNKKITWTSSNKSKATVDSNGKVKAVEPGRVTITAKTANGKTATQELIIGVNNNYIDLKNLSLNTFIKNAQTRSKIAILQGFGILNYNKGNYLFLTQQGTNGYLRLSKMKYDATQKAAIPIADGSEMWLKDFSHGDTLEISTNSDKTGAWVWTMSDNSSALSGMKYGARDNSLERGKDDGDYVSIPTGTADVTYKLHYTAINEKGEKIKYPKKILTVAMDEENNLIALRSGYSTKHTYDVYKFSEWKKIKKEENEQFEKLKEEEKSNITKSTKEDLKNEYINTYIAKAEREDAFKNMTVSQAISAYKNEVGAEEYQKIYNAKYKENAEIQFVKKYGEQFAKELEKIKISSIVHNSEKWMIDFVTKNRSIYDNNSEFKANYKNVNKEYNSDGTLKKTWTYSSTREIDTAEYRRIRDGLNLDNNFQGFDIDGSYIYICEDMTSGDKDDNYDIVSQTATINNNKFGDTLISVYDLAGNVVDKYYRFSVESNLKNKKTLTKTDFYKNVNSITNFEDYEQEGLRIYNGVLFVGAGVRANGETHQNILYFGDKLGIEPKSE